MQHKETNPALEAHIEQVFATQQTENRLAVSGPKVPDPDAARKAVINRLLDDTLLD